MLGISCPAEIHNDKPKFWAWKGAKLLCNTIDLSNVAVSAEEYIERGASSCHKVIKTVY